MQCPFIVLLLISYYNEFLSTNITKLLKILFHNKWRTICGDDDAEYNQARYRVAQKNVEHCDFKLHACMFHFYAPPCPCITGWTADQAGCLAKATKKVTIFSLAGSTTTW